MDSFIIILPLIQFLYPIIHHIGILWVMKGLDMVARSYRVISKRKHHVFGASSAIIDLEGMLPSCDMQPLQHEGNSSMLDLEVPLEQMEAIKIEMQAH